MSTILSNQPITTPTGVSQFAPPLHSSTNIWTYQNRWFRTRILLAVLLIAAASLKAYQIFDDPSESQGLLTSPFVRKLNVQAEFLLAMCLILNWGAIALWCFTLVAFVGFCAVNLTMGIRGLDSCRCLGSLEVNPWHMLIIDTGAVIAVMMSWPGSANYHHGQALQGASQESIRWRDIAVFALGLTLLAWGIAARRLGDLPSGFDESIRFDHVVHDFGDVRQRESLGHTFQLRNDWTDAVEVVRVRSSCSCSIADRIDGYRIEPGESLAVPVTLESGTIEGRRSARITVFVKPVNQVAETWKSVEVSCQVAADYWIRPTLINFGPIDDLRCDMRLVRFRRNKSSDAVITRIEIDSPHFSAKALDSPPTDKDTLIQVSAHPNRATMAGPTQSVMSIHTTSVREPIARVYLQASIQPAIEMTPTTIVVPSTTNGAASKSILLRSKHDFRIVQATCTNNFVAVDYPADTQSNNAVVNVQIPDLKSGMAATIELTVNIGHGLERIEARTMTVGIYRLSTNSEDSP